MAGGGDHADFLTQEGRQRRLSAGLDRLDAWSATASQAERNAVYRALFAVSCGSVFRSYPILTRAGTLDELAVLVRPDLVVRIRLTLDAFDITHIGNGFHSP